MLALILVTEYPFMIKDPFFDREAEKYDSPIASRELILDYLKQEAKRASVYYVP
ncbi:hypothetical protein [Gilliamella sp. Pas-s95]|uniref:hypothetical protein n=1 Tax=Gilliamella sp. Pas-s95 TaxID=2687317 RepID=UPI0013248443|nr:hypothetical protein [Gilliamella sp. Pas-s95]MWN06340.1 hypothetical protein [Gilliamella sp. Pas-s95]